MPAMRVTNHQENTEAKFASETIRLNMPRSNALKTNARVANIRGVQSTDFSRAIAFAERKARLKSVL